MADTSTNIGSDGHKQKVRCRVFIRTNLTEFVPFLIDGTGKLGQAFE
jgi:hypothetical protein